MMTNHQNKRVLEGVGRYLAKMYESYLPLGMEDEELKRLVESIDWWDSSLLIVLDTTSLKVIRRSWCSRYRAAGIDAKLH